MNTTQALDVFDDLLVDLRKSCVDNIRDIESQYQPILELDIDGMCDKSDVHAHVNYLIVKEKTRHYMLTIRRIDMRRRYRNSQIAITENDIERAKEFPIEELYSELVGKKIVHGIASCPFHDDGTASFSMRRHNRYRCFGCDERGSVIDLYMKLNNVGFVEAVKKLSTR